MTGRGQDDAKATRVVGPFRAVDRRFDIATFQIDVADVLHRLFASLACPDRPSVTRFAIELPTQGEPGVLRQIGDGFERNGLLVRSTDRSQLLRHLVWNVNQLAIASSGERLMLHAAAASHEGVGVLLPAAMEAGKTTLVTGLLDRGLAYLSDEAVAVGEDLMLEGYPKPLSIDRGSWEVLAHHRPQAPPGMDDLFSTQWQIPVQEFAPVVSSARLGLVVFPRYRRGATTRLTPLGPSAALARAVACTFGPQEMFVLTARVRQLAGVMERVPTYELESGDLDQACGAVLEALDRATGRLDVAPGTTDPI